MLFTKISIRFFNPTSAGVVRAPIHGYWGEGGGGGGGGQGG